MDSVEPSPTLKEALVVAVRRNLERLAAGQDITERRLVSLYKPRIE